MTFPGFKFTCLTCNESWVEPSVPNGSYGVFILRSSNRSIRSLDADEDKVFEEITVYLKLRSKDQNDRTTANEHHRLFTLTCDPDDKGQPYQFTSFSNCPRCGLQEISWKFDEARTTFEVPHVQHNQWKLLTDNERLEILDAHAR